MIRTRACLALWLAVSVPLGLLAQSAQELYQRGLVAEHAKGDLTGAIAAYLEAANESAGDRGLAARAFVRIGGAQEKLGRRADAIDTYAEVVRAYPEQRTEVAAAQGRLTFLRQASPAAGALVPDDALSMARPLFDRYCVTCHGGANRTAGLDLDALTRHPVEDGVALWETVTRRLQARLDPPGGNPRPDDATYRLLVSRLEQSLDAAHAATHAARATEPVNSVELASRTAAFLWNDAPDAELVAAARRGELRDRSRASRHVSRMLRDPRAGSLVDRFFAEWFSLDRLRRARPDAAVFPQFDADLRHAMATETRLFLQSQVREDHGALDLWTAGYTYVDERLARHYGLTGVSGRAFVRVRWPDTNRGGLLGQAGPLTGTSQSSRTSPTVRGLYVLTRFLGIDAPNPPANVPALAERASRPLGTLRERMAAHKANPSCAACHAVFDPLGLALENFDAIGAWRTTDDGSPIDASGTFIDGTRFSGPAEFRAGLLRYRDAYYAGVTRQLLAFALNRKARGRIYDYEMPAVRQIVRDAAASNYRWSSILAGIVASPPFQAKVVVP